MTPLPKPYAWLVREGAPRILVAALPFHGVAEIKGRQHNPEILAWAAGLNPGVAAWYDKDEHPWCAVFMSHVCKTAGLPYPNGFNAIRAMGFSTWGDAVPAPMLGDVLVFKREGGGHVGLYVGEDATHFHVFGGNQGDRVSIARLPRTQLYAARRTHWERRQPPNVRRVFLSETGAPTTTLA